MQSSEVFGERRRSQQTLHGGLKAGKFHPVLELIDAPHHSVHCDLRREARQPELQFHLFVHRNLRGNKNCDSVLADVPGIAGHQLLLPVDAAPDLHMHVDLGSGRTALSTFRLQGGGIVNYCMHFRELLN